MAGVIPARLRAVYAPFEVLVHEVAKFGVVGAANFVLDVALFNLLHFGLHVGPLTSKTLSTVVAATSSYFMNRHWAFAHRARTGLRREYSLFIVLSAVGLLITLGCLGFTRYALGLTSPLALNVSANGVGLLLATAWRFWSFKRWVFLPPAPVDGPAAQGRPLEGSDAVA